MRSVSAVTRSRKLSATVSALALGGAALVAAPAAATPASEDQPASGVGVIAEDVPFLDDEPVPEDRATSGGDSAPESLAAAAAESELVWREIVFGQSTDLNFASNVLPEKVGLNHAVPEVPGSIEGEILMESRGGKLAPGHDGLVFYYVELDPNEHNFVLETDMILDQLGPETGNNPNGQEGAGIMVRDINGGPRQDPLLEGFEEVPAASNFAAVVWMRNGLNAMTRTGVEYPWGNVGSERPANVFTTDSAYQIAPGTDTPVRLRLERTDTEFIMSVTYTHTGEPVTFSRTLEGADWVQEIAADSMTVGFFASRNAKARFSNSSLTLSEADTQPRPATPPPAVAASFDLRAAPTAGTTDYHLGARSNLDGALTIAVDGVAVGDARNITGGQVHSETIPLPEGSSTVSATFTAPGHDPITRTQDVTVRPFAATDLVAAPDGTPEGAGTLESPLDVTTAVRHVAPGGTVHLRGGTYTGVGLDISAAYSGAEGAPKTLRNHADEEVVLDGEDSENILIRLDGDHWHIQGIELTRAGGNGMRLSGSHNVIENVVFSFNGNSGFQMSGGSDPDLWPAHNLVLDSLAHDNCDEAAFNADGFAAKLGVGPGNVFGGNVAHHNIDDGFDLYNRTNEGANHPITMENNIAYSNGKLSDGTNEGSAVGTGFKVGGEGLPVAHVLIGNLAFDNGLDGFSDNFNPGRLILTNNTSIDNLRFNYIFRTNPYFESHEQGVFRSNLSLHTSAGLDDAISGDVDATNFFYEDGQSVNGAGLTAGAEEFVTLLAPESYQRTAEGQIVWGDYTRPLATSFLASAGLDGTHVGALAPVVAELVPSGFSVGLDLTDTAGLAGDGEFTVAVEIDGEPGSTLVLRAGGEPVVVSGLQAGAEVTLTALPPADVEGGTWAASSWTVDGAPVAGATITFTLAEVPAELVLLHRLSATDPTPEPTDGGSSPEPSTTPADGPSTPADEIPVTGANIGTAVLAGMVLLLAGGAATALTRRARSAS